MGLVAVKVYKLKESEKKVAVLVDVGFPKEAGTQQGGHCRSGSCLEF